MSQLSRVFVVCRRGVLKCEKSKYGCLKFSTDTLTFKDNASVVLKNKYIINSQQPLSLPSMYEVKSVLEPCSDVDVSDVSPNLQPTFNLAAYVDKSPTLQELVKLGVRLDVVERKKGCAEFVLKLDFEKDIKPYIQFLHNHGVEAEKLGKILTKNPWILQIDLDDLQVRINYLESKLFTKNDIGNILSRNPYWLSFSVKRIDEQLGYFQSAFNLTGNEVRNLTNLLPRLITYSIPRIKLNHFVLLEEIGFDKEQIKSLLLSYPALFERGQRNLIESYEYAHKTMAIPSTQLFQNPEVMLTRPFRLRERHMFLQSLGRAQYNPLLPGFIAPSLMVKGTDAHFAENIAKSSVITFNAFLKTL